MSGDWFEALTGFAEAGYSETRAKLVVEGEELVSRVNGQRYAIGRLELVKLATLRSRVAMPPTRRSRLGWIKADVRALHASPEFEGALFQVASQFNLLEMVGPSVTPEDGVTRYRNDPTQGPACAIAAGAATVFRNYFLPVDGHIGQTAGRQVDALASLGDALARHVGRPKETLWTMRNGYALGTSEGLSVISEFLADASDDEREALRGELAIGVHSDVQVTDVRDRRVTVSQAFCSALPVAYSDVPAEVWEPFARLVLEASYEATLLAAVERAARGGSNKVLLTRLGRGAFGNDDVWIMEAIERALRLIEHADLDVRFVCYSGIDARTRRLLDWWGG